MSVVEKVEELSSEFQTEPAVRAELELAAVVIGLGRVRVGRDFLAA